jgi:hypothetical protein
MNPVPKLSRRQLLLTLVGVTGTAALGSACVWDPDPHYYGNGRRRNRDRYWRYDDRYDRRDDHDHHHDEGHRGRGRGHRKHD